MWDMIDFKRCTGHKGHWECADEYPDRMVPVSKFNNEKNGKYGLSALCKKCATFISNINNKNKPRHPSTGQWKHHWKTNFAKSLGGVILSEDWQSYLDKAEAQWNIEVKNNILDNRPAQEYFDWVDSQKESVVKQRVVSIKSRNTSLYNKIKREYGYICQVKGCNECEVELAHLYPHSKDDSIDNETNALVLCANHHSALDGHRMCIELDLTFSRYDRDDNQIEWGEIICHEWHKIDPKFIKKSQEWFINDTKEQALG